MKNQKLIENLNKVAKEDTSWQDDVDFYENNKKWLDYSAQIAISILSKLRANRREGKFPSTQKELAELMNVSPQQINKYVRGTENLTIETIIRISKAIGYELVNFDVNNQESPTLTYNNAFSTTLSHSQLIIPSNNGGFINQAAFTVEGNTQSETKAVGKLQYAMAS
ncbi:helix-turn-helix domain-containing protein [Cellulophaga sp. BC115SP]|uniref:helix-turn-helix domain-containing protein n=1 Tax=Cellulophaga sp. BC115SP TaxID=2683263 RepID=UPI001412E79C|nr:helix-turn-helix transcriptional regulator [Cellulophaga sp. BC115SP]NBB28016.1 helix-turn-helix domain-containing protein [Cellulophaga sp. BC115SP]